MLDILYQVWRSVKNECSIKNKHVGTLDESVGRPRRRRRLDATIGASTSVAVQRATPSHPAAPRTAPLLKDRHWRHIYVIPPTGTDRPNKTKPKCLPFYWTDCDFSNKYESVLINCKLTIVEFRLTFFT